jgi:hypothetical protein
MPSAKKKKPPMGETKLEAPTKDNKLFEPAVLVAPTAAAKFFVRETAFTYEDFSRLCCSGWLGINSNEISPFITNGMPFMACGTSLCCSAGLKHFESCNLFTKDEAKRRFCSAIPRKDAIDAIVELRKNNARA